MDEWVSDTVPAAEAAGDGQYAADSDYISAPGGEDSAEALPEADGTSQPAEEAETPEDGRADTGQDTEKPGRPAPAFTVPVKYNKQYRELTPEEAGIYAQKGMKYESLEPYLARLRFMGQQTGQSLEKVLEGMYQASEDLARKKILDEAGGNQTLADRLMEARRLKNKAAFDAMLADDKKAAESEIADNNQRLAGEFKDLNAEFPAIANIEDVPQSVIKSALRSGRDLLSEYLRYQHTESKRVKQAETQKATAAKASAGSQASGTGPSDTSPEIAAMLQGIWG